MSSSSPTWASGSEIREICCIGAGFVGGTTGAVLASQLEHVNVTVVDLNQARIDAWNSDTMPVWEVGLDNLVRLARGLDFPPYTQDGSQLASSPPSSLYSEDSDFHTGSDRKPNLTFTTNIDDAIRKVDMVFVCVDTPSAPANGLLGHSLCTRTLRKAIERVGQMAERDFILVEKCTVPCGTAKEVGLILQNTVRPGIKFEVLSNPEFLAEGTAVQDLLHPDRVLIGSSATAKGMNAASTLASLYEQWVPREKILTIDAWSAELAKLAANAMLAQRISSINSLSAICESMDADIRTVSKACSLDHRIGSQMLNASVGFGGSCFQKDVSYLVYLAASLGLDQVARYWQAVLDMNDYQQSRFADRVKRSLRNVRDVSPKIVVLGFAFKAKTNDSRNSAAIRIVKELIAEGFEIAIFDPCVSESEIWSAISNGSGASLERVTISTNPHEACLRAHAAVVLTEWDAFRYPVKKATAEITNPFDDRPPTPDSLESARLLGTDEAESDSISDNSDIAEDKYFSTMDGLDIHRHDGDRAKHLEFNNADLVKPGKRQPKSALSTDHIKDSIQWHQVANMMLEPKQIFDGRNIIDDNIVDLGFKIERIGKMSSSPYI